MHCRRMPRGIIVRKPGTKKKMITEWDGYEAFATGVIKQAPKIILVQSAEALRYITGDRHQSLAMARGSVYRFQGIPAIVLDKPEKAYQVRHGKIAMLADIAKAKRWYLDQQRPQPPFSYEVCNDLMSLHRFKQSSLTLSPSSIHSRRTPASDFSDVMLSAKPL